MSTLHLVPPPADSPERLRCPYQGLTPYTEEDAAFFYGREQDSRLILDNVRAYPISVLYGPSGVGKSSVLRAGVLRLARAETERLRERFGVVETATAYCCEWRDEPGATLRAALWDALESATGGNPGFDRAGDGGSDAGGAGAEWAEVVASCARLEVDLLVILDQFEEYFLYHDDEGDRFGRLLARLLPPGSRVSVLIAIREDAVARLDRFEAPLPGVFDHTLRLEHLDRQAARAAILEPPRHLSTLLPPDRRWTVDDQLVDDLLDQVAAGRVRVSSHPGAETAAAVCDRDDGRIEAPYLQLVLTRLWEEESGEQSHRLRAATLSRLGGAQQIVREHLDRVVAAFEPADHEMLAAVFGHLVTPGGTKIAHTVSDLAQLTGVEETRIRGALLRLTRGDQRILREVDPPTEAPTDARFEIFHDVLALAVLDWRRRWLAARAQAAAHEALAEEKVQAQRRARQAHRRLRRARVLTVGLLALVLAGVLLVRSLGDALDRAEQGELMAQARRQLAVDPSRSLADALQAWGMGHTRSGEELVRQGYDAADTALALDAGDEPVLGAWFVDGGARVVTASADGFVRVFDAGSGERRLVVDVGDADVESASMVGDEEYVVLGTAGAGAVVVPLDGGEPRRLTGPGLHGGVSVAAAGGTGASGRGTRVLLVGNGDDAGAQLWDVRSGTRLRTFRRPEETVWAAALDAGGRFAATWSWDLESERIRVWSIRTGRLLAVADVGWGGGLRFRPGRPGELLAVGDDPDRGTTVAGRPVMEWAWRTSDPTWRRVGEAHYDLALLDIDRSGRWLTFAGDKSAWVWDSRTGTATHGSLSRDWILASALSPAAPGRSGRPRQLLALATMDGEVILDYADRENNRPLWVFRGHGAPVRSVAFDPSGERILTAADDGTVRVWRVPDRVVDWGTRDREWLLFADFTRSGRQVVVGSASGEIRYVDPGTGETLSSVRRPDGGSVDSLGVSPDGRSLVVTGSGTLQPQVLDREGRAGPTLEYTDAWAIKARWDPSPGRRRVVAAMNDHQVTAWDLDSINGEGEANAVWTAKLGTPGEDVVDLDFSRDGGRLAVVSTDGYLRLLDPDDGSVVGRVEVGGTTDVALSPDGTRAATAGLDQTVRIWDLDRAGGGLVQELTDPTGTVPHVTFSDDPDHLRVAAVSADLHTYVWDADGGLLLADLRRHGDMVNWVDFDPRDPGRLVTASDDGTSAVYPCTPCDIGEDDLADRARERLPNGGS